MGFSVLKKEAHKDVQNHFINSPFEEKLGIKIYKRLDSLFRKRKDADYEMGEEYTFSRDEAELLIGQARLIIDHVEACQDDTEIFNEIKQSIEIWRTGRGNPGKQ